MAVLQSTPCNQLGSYEEIQEDELLCGPRGYTREFGMDNLKERGELGGEDIASRCDRPGPRWVDCPCAVRTHWTALYSLRNSSKMCARANATLTYLGQNRDEVMKYVEYRTVIKWSEGSQYLQNGYKPVFRQKKLNRSETPSPCQIARDRTGPFYMGNCSRQTLEGR